MLMARAKQQGFTLIELMTVVAIIGILMAVVIPYFFKEGRKVKADTEVTAMFAEISTREEQYKIDNGSYGAVAECPTVTSATGVAASTCMGGGSDWLAMRINPPESTVRCKYQVFTGTTAGTLTQGGFTYASPAASWYFMLATCDMDGNSSTNATFSASSSDTKINKLNEGN